MSLTTVNYLVLTNEDWRDTLELENNGDPVDLTGSAFRAQLRTTADTLAVALDASTSNGRMVIADAPGGILSWNVAPEVLEDMEPGTYVYDIVWTTPGGVEDTIVDGTITLKRGVTRS
ncbi:MAG TPA: hypothetical protein VIL30_04465 [Ramlibacter sp.]|jgi:hypothetical protein